MGKKIRITRRTSFRHFELIFNRIHAIHAFCASAEGQRHNSLSDLPRDAGKEGASAAVHNSKRKRNVLGIPT